MYPDPIVSVGEPAIDVECEVLRANLRHGRDDATTQPVASAATLELVGILPPEAVMGAPIILDAELAGIRHRRFTGRISDISIAWEGEQALATIIAVSDLAITGRRVIGDTPWPAELDGQRVNRVLTLAGFPPDPIRTDPGSLTVLARDVDRQPAIAVAHDAADDGDGIVWQARDGAILYADVQHRRGAAVAAEFMACDIGAGAGWTISLEGVVNDATVRYGAAEPQAEARATTGAAELYAASLSTRIASLADAQKRADAMVARQAEPAWIFGGLELELAAPWWGLAESAAILELDMHSLVSVTGLPAGSPATSALLWVEGWAERVEPGSWGLSLFTSDYCRTASYARWDDLDAGITWDSIDPARTWGGASCIPPQPARGRWNDVPASQRWDTTDPAITWDAWA